jgi:exonuclease III
LAQLLSVSLFVAMGLQGFPMLEQPINIMGWNTRGLNDQDRRDAVHETIASSSCHIVCLQETKLQDVSQFDAAYIGGHRLRSFAQRPAIGTRGGILLLWDDSVVAVSNIVTTEFCLSAEVHIIDPENSRDGDFKITGVYGPMAHNRKDDFFAQLLGQKPAQGVPMVSSWRFQSDSEGAGQEQAQC